MVTIRGWVVRETEKAVLFIPHGQMDRQIWLPKSQITIISCEWDDLLEIPIWLAEKNNIRAALPPPTPVCRVGNGL